MEEKRIEGKIIDKSMKEGEKWERYSIVLEHSNGTMNLSYFPKAEEEKVQIRMLKIGQNVDFRYYDTQKDNITYHNILSFSVVEVESSEPEQKSEHKTFYGNDEFRQRLIVRQSCLAQAIKFCESVKDQKEINPSKVKELAEDFERWVWRNG